MVNEAELMNELISIIIQEFEERKPEGCGITFTDANVVWDTIDLDRMTSDIEIFLEANSVNLSPLTTQDDEARMGVSLAVIAKRDTKENIRDKLFTVKAVLYSIFKDYISLSDDVEEVEVESWYYIPSVFLEDGIGAMDIAVTFTYCVR